MILDSSAVVAIAEGEPEREQFLELAAGVPCRMSVANWLEAALVIDNRSPRGRANLDDLTSALSIELVPVSVAHALVARDAHRRFGRGSGSPARLNFGDCLAYALAVTTGEPLLYTGEDFGHTDVRSALT